MIKQNSLFVMEAVATMHVPNPARQTELK